MKNKKPTTDDFIDRVASRAGFAKKDVKDILDAMVSELEKYVEDSDDDFTEENPKTILKLRGFGRLAISEIGERKGNDGNMLPKAYKVFFTLSRNIRNKKIEYQFYNTGCP